MVTILQEIDTTYHNDGFLFNLEQISKSSIKALSILGLIFISYMGVL